MTDDSNGDLDVYAGRISITGGPARPNNSVLLTRHKLVFAVPGEWLARNPIICGTDSQLFWINPGNGEPSSWSSYKGSGGDWLLVSPESGSGKGTMTVGVSPQELPPGNYSGDIMIVPGSSDPSQHVYVNYIIYQPGTTNPPFGGIDTPVNESTVRSSVPVTGWVLDDLGIEHVKIYRQTDQGPVYLDDANLIEGARPDIEASYPDYPSNYKAGWGYMLLTNFLPNNGNGTYTITAYATDKEGKETNLGSKTIICDNANAVKPFGGIDTPAQGGTASGAQYVVSGWVLTPQPSTIPTNGQTIFVNLDGTNAGNPQYNIYRQDIAQSFPGYNNSDGAGANFTMDTTTFANGVHTLSWTVTDDNGNTHDIGSRHFIIHNN